MTEDEMVGWHHRLSRHESEQALGDGEGQGNLAACSPWGCKESDMIEQLNTKTIAHQPLSMGFSRQEYWSELPFPSPGNLPDPGIEPMSPASAGRFFTSEPPGKLFPFPNLSAQYPFLPLFLLRP